MADLRHDEARRANAAEFQITLEETSHRPVLRNGYTSSPLRNTAPSHAPCDGRMTGTGRSPGLRIVTVARLPKPGSKALLSGLLDNGSPLTVAGAASELPR